MTDHQRDKRKGVYKTFSQNKKFFHSCLIWLFTEHFWSLGKEKKPGSGFYVETCCLLWFLAGFQMVSRSYLIFVRFLWRVGNVPQNLNCRFSGLIRKESFNKWIRFNGCYLLRLIFIKGQKIWPTLGIFKVKF